MQIKSNTNERRIRITQKQITFLKDQNQIKTDESIQNFRLSYKSQVEEKPIPFFNAIISILLLINSPKMSKRKHNKQVHEYITTKINTFIEPLVYELVLQKPNDPVVFAIEWLTKYNQKIKEKSLKQMDSDAEEEQLDQVIELENKIATKKANRTHHKSRVGISEEVFGLFNVREDINLNQEHNLTQDEEILVKSLIRNSIFFKNLDNKDQDVILRAISSKEAEQYELIIKEGEAGDVLYIVESGEYDCYKLVDDENVYIKTYYAGEAFGELALMYNAPRAASIVTKKPGKLLTLHRSTFSYVLKIAALRKQDIIKEAIEKLEIFKSIPIDDRHQLINILNEEKYHQGQYVIQQGQEGDKFYIVLEGTLVAEKREGHDLPKIVYKYEVGDYFGQLALINNEPRQASIRALTSAKVAFVTSQGFRRVFGTITQTFKENSQKYQ